MRGNRQCANRPRMGASLWSYLVPYEANISSAFSRLQGDVFARSEFYARKDTRFGSIEELREAQAEDGTHSIIDMLRVVADTAPPPPGPAALAEELLAAIVGAASRYGTVFQMSDQELQKCYSTTTPSRNTIECNESSAHSLCERGNGRYALVFDDEGDKTTPTWIYFVGVSGD